MAPAPLLRRRLLVAGTVQGVGFRPFVFNLATGMGLTGFVRNDPAGVVIEIEGPAADMALFETALSSSAPPLAVIERVKSDRLPLEGSSRFEIADTEPGGTPTASIAPDVAACDDCLAEIRDPSARRFRYAFTNCTSCGPRFTIALAVPYDRSNTTMAIFEMCAACRAEYEDPTDRRFHAQPIACPACGPRLSLTAGDVDPEGDPIARAARSLIAGSILAVKGLGGYHLACDATSEGAVAQLRQRKGREEKPLALMVPDLRWARRVVEFDPTGARLLTSRRKPIVLLPRVADAPVASAVAPGNRVLGVMLPFTCCCWKR